ncbi:(2Fe-2S)-binding protein [Segnochrobactrum spirostomi]|uniref:(2Fe-2S)-binding protein n=1 Tax=Segnochrobactrum spirostomi TaxID=2608987 RepID=UPI001AD7FA17|nr:hypothetical protein [Segnochrobactrum spirostomi]
MMVCSCNRLSSEALAEAAVEVAAAPGRGIITPGAVFRTLGCRPQCGGCFPLVIEVIHKATAGLPELAPAPQPEACCGGHCHDAVAHGHHEVHPHAAPHEITLTAIVETEIAAVADGDSVLVTVEDSVTLVTDEATVFAVSETLVAASPRDREDAPQGATIVRLDLYADKASADARSDDAEQPARRRAV